MARSSAYVRLPFSPWKNIEKSSWRFGSTTTRTESPELDFAVAKLARPAATRRILLRENISCERDEQLPRRHIASTARSLWPYLATPCRPAFLSETIGLTPGRRAQTPTGEAVPVFVKQSSSGPPSSRPPLFSLSPLLLFSISLWALQKS